MRNMTRRRMMLISSATESRIPNEYREVQWLRGTGTQYCETNFVPKIYPNTNNYSGIKGDITILNLNNSKLSIMADDIYGGSASQGRTRFGIEINNGNFTFDYGFLGASAYPSPSTKSYLLSNFGSAPLDLHYEINIYDGNIKLNNVSYPIYSGNTTSFNKLLIGAYYSGLSNISVLNENTLIKAFSVYEKNELIGEYIPCYRKSDNKAGFYETSTGIFLTNLGSGSDWLVGPKV